MDTKIFVDTDADVRLARRYISEQFSMAIPCNLLPNGPIT